MFIWDMDRLFISPWDLQSEADRMRFRMRECESADCYLAMAEIEWQNSVSQIDYGKSSESP